MTKDHFKPNVKIRVGVNKTDISRRSLLSVGT